MDRHCSIVALLLVWLYVGGQLGGGGRWLGQRAERE